MGFCLVLLYCSCSTALRLGTEPLESQRTFSVTVQFSGPSHDTTTAILSIFKNGKSEGELEEGEPRTFVGLTEGEVVNVGTGSSCSYIAGNQMKTCLFEVGSVVFTSQEEVEETLELKVLVTRIGSGTGPPFDVKINGVTNDSDSGTVAEGKTWFRIIPVVDNDMATVLFTQTNTSCAYSAGRHNIGIQTCEADGMKTEFETMISKPYTGSNTDFSKRTDVGIWKVHLFIVGKGPEFNILLDDKKMYTEGPHKDSMSAARLFDAEIGQTVKFMFENGNQQYTYKVGNEKQSLIVEDYDIEMETMPTNQNN